MKQVIVNINITMWVSENTDSEQQLTECNNIIDTINERVYRREEFNPVVHYVEDSGYIYES